MTEKKEETYADRFAEHASGKNFDVATSIGTVKGWNDRRQSNNQVISSLVPFVQLIGLFDEKEYNRLFKTSDKAVSVVFDDNGGNQSDEYDKKYKISPNFYNNIKQQIGDRFIDIHIIKSVDHGLEVAPIQGIIMAEKVTQVEDASGGIGITDLQVDYGKSNVLGSRKFNIRITINDPKILDERFEYSKLATFGAQFLLLYGWSNPESIPGYDAAMSPPKLEVNPNSDSEPKRKRLIVPIRDLGNGGYWSAARVNISKYDFGFNEMGKLEINVTLRDDATLGMSSTTMSSIAKQFKQFISDGSLDEAIVTQSGDEFTLRDALNQRQQELSRYYNSIEDPTAEDYAEYSSQWEMAVEHYSNVITIDGTPTGAPDPAQEGDENPYWNEDKVRENTAEARATQKGYPFQQSLNVFQQKLITVLDDNPDDNNQIEWDDEADKAADDAGAPASLAPTKQIPIYEKRPAYYFLGALMDSVSLCMAGPQLGLGTSTVPSFFYRDVSPDSKLSTAFQSKIKSVNRATGMEERIQEAIIRLKERFMPPTPIQHYSPGSFSWTYLNRALADAATTYPHGLTSKKTTTVRGKAGSTTTTVEEVPYNSADHAFELFNGPFNFLQNYVKKKGSVQVSGPTPVYDGRQTIEKTRVINALFPAPPKIRHMLGAPMRGFFISVNTGAPEYASILSKNGLAAEGHIRVYIPDWKQETAFDAEGNETISSGSPDGFDPLDPTEYRAAMPSGDPHPYHPGFEERSQAPYGRGGRFFMIMAYEKLVEVSTTRRRHDPGRLIVSYDVWRQTNKKTWNLLQKTWHNLYREYLSAYFERVIRLRINEIEALGIPIESIFNEPLDLDWMTGMIYRNQLWKPGYEDGDSQFKSYADVAGHYLDDMNVDAEIEKINQKATESEDSIALNRETIEGKGLPPDFDPTFTGEYEAAASAEASGLQGAALRRIKKINILKIQIERLTGGHYQRDRDGNFNTKDIMGNTIILRFKNFLKVMATDEVIENTQSLVHNPETELPEVFTIVTYKSEIEYERKPGTPVVKEEWVLWNDFNVPTNNFQNRFNVENREWDDKLNKAENWKQANDSIYQSSVLSKIDADNKLLQEKLNTISLYQDQLSEIYESYQECQIAIDNAETNIANAQRKLTELQELFNDQGKIELSLYDDTSDFDGDGVKIDVGRDEPMHLTTMVAQQWWRRFSPAARRGCQDVGNYGPPQAGKPFQLPTNTYKFTFDRSRREWAVQGQPVRVLDPAFFNKLLSYETWQFTRERDFKDAVPRLLRDLSHGINPSDAASLIISKDLDYEETQIGHRTEKSYKNWSLFGTPGIPNENGNNQWGFRYGPPFERTLANDTIEQLGGNYVRTYKDFLNLFGLGYNPNWSGPLRIIEKWPMPWDTNRAITGGTEQRRLRSTGTPFPAYYPEAWKDRQAKQETETGESYFAIAGGDGADYHNLLEATGVPMYTLVDEIGNIIVDDGKGWYRPSGWFLDFAGDPVFLYPSRHTACKINNTSKYTPAGVGPGQVIKRGGLGRENIYEQDQSGDRQRSGVVPNRGNRTLLDGDGNYSGRTKKLLQKAADAAMGMAKQYWNSYSKLFSGDLVGFLKSQAKLYVQQVVGLAAIGGVITGFALGGPLGASIAHTMTLGLFNALRSMKTKHLNDGFPTDYLGTKAWKRGGPWGLRIGEGEHNMNLTLDMKQSMIQFRPTTEDETNYLGHDSPCGQPDSSSPQYSPVDWNNIIQRGNYYYVKDNGYPEEQQGKLANYKMVEEKDENGDTTGRLIPSGGVLGPTKEATWPPYSNPEYPYGTGWYTLRGSGKKQHGPYVFPERAKNWMDWGDFLERLPGYGFLTQIDNSNYSSCVVQPNGQITDGLEMNDGFVKFVIENVFAPLPKNRRIAARNNHKPIKILGNSEYDEVSNYHESKRLNDVTYADLFGPLNDNSEDDEPVRASLDPATFGNIDNFVIDNVKSIPIRAEIVNNLVNKNNANMSIVQFFGEIFKPGAVGVNSGGNQQVACRQGEDGTFELFAPSSINWEEMAKKYAHLWGPGIGKEEEYKKRFPKDIIVLDFKAKDSLIESMDMNSTFDPITARAFRDASVDFTGNSDALLHFMSYKDIAPDLIEFFKKEAPDIQSEEAEKEQAITIDASGKVTLNRKLFMENGETKDVITNTVSKYLQANPARLNSMRALLLAYEQGKSSTDEDPAGVDNYATQLLANYMRKTTVTIHGTTNIAPFQKIIIKGIMPDLEGMYLITSTRESITPQGFQTILEGSLVRRPSGDARVDEEGKNVVPEGKEQDEVAKAAARHPEGNTVEEAAAVEDFAAGSTGPGLFLTRPVEGSAIS